MLNCAFILYFYYFEVLTNLVAVFAVSVFVVVVAVVAVVVSEQEVTVVVVAGIQLSSVKTVRPKKLVFLLLKQPQ
jgi:hypothetical protein